MADPRSFCSYAEFGEVFVRAAVSKQRITDAIGRAIGPIEFGPKPMGPGGVAEVTAHGTPDAPVVRELAADELAYQVMVPVHLDFEVDLQVDKHRFHGELVIPLTVHARTTDDLKILIEITGPRARDIRPDLKGDGLRASVIKRAASMDAEVKRFVAKYVAREIESPRVQAQCTVDVGAGIEATWAAMSR